jgi:hypothetical protein
MKTLTSLCLLLLAGTVFAQKLDKEEAKAFFWGKDDAFKSANTIPEKYKNESAVVIYKYEFYDYHKFGTSIKYVSAMRKRIKLQDAAAVKEFSEFSFQERFRNERGRYGGDGTNTVGIKIIKPGGKEIEIDVDKESKDVNNEKKIAIASLEQGDIIDFYLYHYQPFNSQLEYGFEPEETTLGDTYPIMDYKLNFRTENDFFLNFASYNGAPELKQMPTDKSSERRYELVAKDIAKNDFPRWFYPLVELPSYKFQVFFARSGKFEKRAEAFLAEKENVVKKTVSKEDVFEYYSNKFRPYGDMAYIEKFLKKKTFANDEEKVREVYYFTRHQYFTQYVEAFVVKEANIFYPFDLYGNAIFMNSENEFINHFMAFLKDNKLDYDIIIGTARYNGPIEDLLIQKDLSVLLRVNTTPNPVYLEYFSPYTSADQFSYELENSNAYALNVTKRKKITDVSLVKLPGTTAAENRSKSVFKIKLNEDMTGLKVDRESSHFGHLKDTEQKDKLYFFDYVNEDYAKYETKALLDRVGNKKKQEQYRKEFDALINKSKDKQKEEFKKATEGEYDVKLEDYAFSIANTGRFGSKTPLVVKEQFSIDNNLVKKAGDNYMVEIGKMIGSQVEIDKKEKARTNNVYFSFPRSFENEVVFEIPAGYTVSGLDKLNKNITNAAGSFVSTTKINGNQLVIQVKKSYTNYYEPNSNWPKVVDFLDAAYQFTQEKILLKKG